jgi:peptidoglycan/LPS O-acetylase OafA/YrhL
VTENKPLTSLRGIAALWVVAFHLNLWVTPEYGMAEIIQVFPPMLVKDGYLAVDIFFTLSGFIIASRYAGLDTAQMLPFFVKRVCRIYPLHLTIMLGLLALRLWATRAAPNQNMQYDWVDFPYVLLLVQPFFPDHADGWNPPSWSAGIEIGCYLLFPFISLLALRAPRRLLLPCIVAIAAVQILLLANVQPRDDGHAVASFGWVAVLRGILGFGLGVLLQQRFGTRPVISERHASLLGTLLCAGLVLSVGLGLPWLVPGVAALLICVLASDRGLVCRVLRNPVLHWLGLVSFSVYLLHHPLLGFFQRALPLRLVPLPMPYAGWAYAGAFLVLLLAASTLSYRLVEQLGRRMAPWIIARLRRTRQLA